MIAAVCLAAPLSPILTAQAVPPRISNLADSVRLSDREKQEIAQYAEYWVKGLSAQGADEVDDAAGKLTEPLRAIQVSDVFRLEYAQTLVPHLDDVIDEGHPHAAVNAMQIVALLGTPNALDLITSHASVANEQNSSIRLWSAKAFPLAVQQGIVDDIEINRALRAFGQAAGQEDRWLVLRRQFEAIASVESTVSRDVLVGALDATAVRMEGQPGPSDLMQATYPALLLLRNEYLELKPPDQKAIGTSLAPVLSSLCNVAQKHWDSAQEDARASRSYRGTVQVSENLLIMIDANVRPRQAGPRTGLGPAWDQRDRRRFEDDNNKWHEVVSGPPYQR